jgi:ribonuclease R
MAKKKYADFKENVRLQMISLFESNPKKLLNHKQVAAAVGIKDAGLRALVYEILLEEANRGLLREVEHGKFILSHAPTQSIQGILEINRYGKGYVKIEGREKDIEIPKGKTGFALWGDTVEISFNPKSRRPEGRILSVVRRFRTRFVGILQNAKGHFFVLPSDKRLHVDFYISKDQLNGAKEGEKVLVEMTTWDRADSNPFAKVVEVFGKPGEHFAEMHAIIAEFGLPNEFPEEVEKYAESIPTGITPEEIAKRRDFRKITTFTIDPFDAKDFDDAISFQTLPNGNYEVGVHIADVSFYVKPESILEKEAFNRATSVYLVDRTIPMLPERLSNFLCSLRPNEEKLCYSAVFEMNDKADVLNTWIGRTVIYSDRRFTYEEAQQAIETGQGDYVNEIQILDKLAKKLREKRFAAGSMDFNSEEVKFKLDEKGFPLGVYVKVMKDSNQLIEDFMLLANRKVAELVGLPKDGHQPKTFVYRIHDKPDPEKLSTLRTFLKHLGYRMPKSTDAENKNIIKSVMRMVEGQAEQPMVTTMAIRSMAKAEYSTKNIGHFGLAFEHYTHFTSPIRRYPDVMVHRLIERYLHGGASAEEKEYDLKCSHSSLMEKRAADAERASIKYKQVEYMLMHQEEVFEGIISGIASWGIYVELVANKCEGLVSINSLKDDFYEFDSEAYVLRGARRKQEFHLGDKLMVKVAGGDLQQRTLDFELIKK